MAKSKSDNLRKAKEKKNDEFYTHLEDIEAEISQHEDYTKHFQNKIVFCNCDDPDWSNFFVFFKLHFKQLGLKKLITTHYNRDGLQSYKLEWSGEMLGNDMVNLIKTPLKGNGDFRSDECVEILKESDIIVTNPPFSIAREDFIPLLYKYNKKFIIVGDLNWVAYKTVFPLFKSNKMFFGYTTVKEFKTPDGTMQKFGNKTWFTNLDLDKSHEPLILTKNYNESNYPKYDNYDAIECSKVRDIPKDYFPCWYECPNAKTCEYAQSKGKKTDKILCKLACNGLMGVPITYLSEHCAEQFIIMGLTSGRNEYEQIPWPTKRYVKPIQHSWDKENSTWKESNGSKANTRAMSIEEHGNKEIYYTAENVDGRLLSNYARILIQRKQS